MKTDTGRTRALRYKSTDSYLFPVTMISRRREVDDRTPVGGYLSQSTRYPASSYTCPPLSVTW